METQVVDEKHKERGKKKAQAKPELTPIQVLVAEWNETQVLSFDVTYKQAKVFLSAKDKLVTGLGKSVAEKKDWYEFLKQIKVSDSSAVKWEAIADCRYFSREEKDEDGKDNPYLKYTPLWPTSWTTLYEISLLTPEQLSTGVQQGIIKPDVTGAAVKALKPQFKKFEDFNPKEQAEIYEAHASALATVPLLAERYGTNEKVIQKLIDDEGHKRFIARTQNQQGVAALDPSGLGVSHKAGDNLSNHPAPAEPEAPAKLELVKTPEAEPTQSQIEDAMVADYSDDHNDVVALQEVQDAYSELQLNKAKKLILKVLHDMEMQNVQVEMKMAASA